MTRLSRRGIWANVFDRIRAFGTRGRQAETEEIRTLARFRNLANALPDATLLIDSEGRLTWCNESATALLGLRMPGDLGLPVTRFVRDPAFCEWLTAPGPADSRLEMSSPTSSEQWLQLSLVPIQDDQRLIIMRDITDMHSVEQMRRDFVANISHEVRTPVTVLLGYLELLQDHPSPEVRNAIQRMQSQTIQMRALLDDLLELSRLQRDEIQGEEQEVDVPAMLDRLKEQAEEISRGRHRIRFEVQPGLHLRGVAADLESAFRNLIINAINYTPPEGSIVATWRDDAAEGPRFTVSDTGPGIPPQHLPRLTERFYRVSPDRARQSGGTGLGLAIVKHVLNAHKARLVIHSELGSGSEFNCVFPPERRLVVPSAPHPVT